MDEDTLARVLRTVLGVAELPVSGLFQAIDHERKGHITFRECPLKALPQPNWHGGPVSPGV